MRAGFVYLTHIRGTPPGLPDPSPTSRKVVHTWAMMYREVFVNTFIFVQRYLCDTNRSGVAVRFSLLQTPSQNYLMMLYMLIAVSPCRYLVAHSLSERE